MKYLSASDFLLASGFLVDLSAKAESWEGVWAFDKDWCQYSDQIGDHDPAPIRITRSEFVGLENRCVVKQLNAVAGEMVLNMECEGEGENYTDRIYLQVEEDTLKIRRTGEETTQFHRCE